MESAMTMMDTVIAISSGIPWVMTLRTESRSSVMRETRSPPPASSIVWASRLREDFMRSMPRSWLTRVPTISL